MTWGSDHVEEVTHECRMILFIVAKRTLDHSAIEGQKEFANGLHDWSYIRLCYYSSTGHWKWRIEAQPFRKFSPTPPKLLVRLSPHRQPIQVLATFSTWRTLDCFSLTMGLLYDPLRTYGCSNCRWKQYIIWEAVNGRRLTLSCQAKRKLAAEPIPQRYGSKWKAKWRASADPELCVQLVWPRLVSNLQCNIRVLTLLCTRTATTVGQRHRISYHDVSSPGLLGPLKFAFHIS